MNPAPAIITGLMGVALLLWAFPLSVRYNSWTTRLRERHPDFNPPPTPKWRARNTKIFAVLLRVVGAFLVVYAVLLLLAHSRR